VAGAGGGQDSDLKNERAKHMDALCQVVKGHRSLKAG